MNILEPSQLFEMILSCQNHYSCGELSLNVRTFNKMIDELIELDLSVRFGYSDFIDFIESDYDFIPIRQNILYIPYTEELYREVRHCNRIHENIDKFLTTKELWQSFLK